MAEATILVVLSDRQWTEQAIHLACALARNLETGVTLVKMSPVIHAQHLGTNHHRPGMEDPQLAPMFEYVKTSEDYGVAIDVTYLHYAGYVSGLVSAAEQLGAIAVFAPAAEHSLALWARFQNWRLRHGLRCPLFTLGASDEPASVVMPLSPAVRPSVPDVATSRAAARHP